MPFVNCRQFMYLVISLLVMRAGCGIWLYQFRIIAYLFTCQRVGWTQMCPLSSRKAMSTLLRTTDRSPGRVSCKLLEHIICKHILDHLEKNKILTSLNRGARWLSGRESDSGARGRGFETYPRRVVSLSKTLYSPKVLVNYPGSGGSVPTWLKNCWLRR